MKLAIIGSRSFAQYELLRTAVYSHFSFADSCLRIDEIISGGAIGADKLGAKFANENNIKLTEFIPDWDKYGKRAGFMRNEDIIGACDCVLAFWDGKSKGTGNSLAIAKRLKKTTLVIYY